MQINVTGAETKIRLSVNEQRALAKAGAILSALAKHAGEPQLNEAAKVTLAAGVKYGLHQSASVSPED